MPRGERPLDEGDGPLLRFAADLRRLREKAGSPVYRELSRRAHYSTAVLSEAAGGRKLPSLAVTLAYVTACEGDPVAWERRWREVAAELSPAETPSAVVSPYLGLAPFEIADRDRFFGRDALLGELAEALGEHRVVCVAGASGAGKSSLLRAGLAARESRRRVVLFTPGPHPFEECAVRLAVVAGWSAPKLRDELAADPANLHLRVRQAAADGEVLLIVDQFEEIFTRCADDAERRAFVTALAHAAEADTSRCRVVLGLRADFLDELDACPELRDVAQVPMRPMTADELREAVTKPALAAGLTLETALVARLVADASDRAGTLALVSQALKETWHRRQGMTLTLAAYDEAGGIRHAIAHTAEAVYLALEPAERDIARQICLRLTAFGDGAEDTKRRVDLNELDDSAETQAVLAELIRSRLVTAGRHGIEFTHEALLVTWPRLKEWRSEDRDGLRTHRQLTEAAAAWIALGRDGGALYRGLRLLIVEDWIHRAKPTLSARERSFFTASVAVERERQQFERRQSRRLRQLVVLLVVLLLVAISVGVYALGARATIAQQLREQAVQNVETQIPSLMRSNRYLAAQLALTAYRTDSSPLATGRLLEFGAQNYFLPLVGNTAVDRGADLAATAGPNGAVTLTELAAGDQFGKPHADVIPPTGAFVDSLALSADGQLLAVSYDDGGLALFDVTKRAAPVRTWFRQRKRVVVSFSRSGRILATAGHPVDDIVGDRRRAPVDTDTTLWNVTEPNRVSTIGTLPEALGPAGFSADGATVTTVPPGHDVRLPQVWKRMNGRWDLLPTSTPDEGADYDGVTVSADGSLVSAAAGDLRSMRTSVWQVQDNGKVTKIATTSATAAPLPLAFDDRGRYAAGVEADGTVLLWALSGADSPVKAAELVDVPKQPQSMFFTAGGDLVIVATDSLAVWPTDPETAARAVCNLPRDGFISQNQWASYFPDSPMPCEGG